MKFVINGQVVNVGGSGGGTSGDVYSTEEQVIGTWIDGKPLYRRVLTGTTPGSSASTKVPNFAAWPKENIPTKVNASLVDMYNCYCLIPTAHMLDANDAANASVNLYISLGGTLDPGIFFVYSGTGSSKYRNRPAIIIIEYTKTTDPEV